MHAIERLLPAYDRNEVHATLVRAPAGRFKAYWFVIRPGSALIRRMWLRAIKRRAEEP